MLRIRGSLCSHAPRSRKGPAPAEKVGWAVDDLLKREFRNKLIENFHQLDFGHSISDFRNSKGDFH